MTQQGERGYANYPCNLIQIQETWQNGTISLTVKQRWLQQTDICKTQLTKLHSRKQAASPHMHTIFKAGETVKWEHRKLVKHAIIWRFSLPFNFCRCARVMKTGLPRQLCVHCSQPEHSLYVKEQQFKVPAHPPLKSFSTRWQGARCNHRIPM